MTLKYASAGDVYITSNPGPWSLGKLTAKLRRIPFTEAQDMSVSFEIEPAEIELPDKSVAFGVTAMELRAASGEVFRLKDAHPRETRSWP